MCNLRKVMFRVSEVDGFTPGLSDEKTKEQENRQYMRPGYFHEWTQVAEIDPKTELAVVEKHAIIEDEKTHQIKIIPAGWFKFTDAPSDL